MRVEGLAIALRPRSPSEACDLGLALVRRHARSIWRCFTPVFLVVAVLALCTVDSYGWAPVLIVFWLKPWLDRVLVFVLARAVFGEATHWRDLWRARRQVLGGQLLRTLLWRRVSPWRAYTQPIEQLEGQRGGARRKRSKLMLNDNRGAATALQTAFAHAEAVLTYGLVALLWWFAPENRSADVWEWLVNPGSHAAGELGMHLLMSVSYMAVVLFLEPFYVAAGFAMYLNRRVALEAWDIEQEFRRAFA
ncbi:MULTISPECIES: hypothetical protein [unclassified Roseateles]|uniref:hypothetical protein n=1 Tax=unclassified Roseateles TaxID=2626991 RepID=UPI0006F5D253|nr:MULTISPECIES: hypothetical protein [unclassified Roseateles]KQW46288.1 hypothetical protein ASC81_07700 [Pelomonas sp. Root405]KRA73337.1 hypothetical protein ASD88_07700 [Pelomonas sp. Root662]